MGQKTRMAPQTLRPAGPVPPATGKEDTRS